MTLELYYLEETDSICSNRVVVALWEKGITDYLDDLKPSPALKPVNLVERSRMKEWVKLFDERGYEATAVVNFATKFRLTIPREVMEERWKSVPNIDRLYRQRSVITDGVDSPYVMRAIGAFESIFVLMEDALSDGRPFLMGDQFTLAEVNFGPFMKVLEMVRFIDFWLEPYPFVRDWWDRLAKRPSMQQLDAFPSNALAEDSPHARTGKETRPAFEAKVSEYRKAFAHAYRKRN